MEKVKVKQIVDDKIYVSLPEPEILDNYVIMDSIQCTESNNILNPISFSQYQRVIEKIEQNELQKLEQNGLYDRAEEHAKEMVISFLSAFEGYEVEFL